MTIAREDRQQILPWPGGAAPCPKCRARGEVYYLQTRQPDVEIIGGRRIICPACGGVGMVWAPEPHTRDAPDTDGTALSAQEVAPVRP
jgi:hypothetical protein